VRAVKTMLELSVNISLSERFEGRMVVRVQSEDPKLGLPNESDMFSRGGYACRIYA
jgi:hypothetical protein